MVSEMGINMKIAVVTGASSGLGREFAKQIAANIPDSTRYGWLREEQNALRR